MTASTPVDHGYAWVVLAATLCCNYLSGVMGYFVGVIHAEMLDKYRDDVTTTAWAGSLFSGLQQMAAPLASAVVNRYSCRTSVLLGSVFICAGFVLSSFTTSVIQLVFTYGLLAGIGVGLTYSPSHMIISFYFHKYQGVACGVSVAGCGLGILTGSLIARLFIDTYSLNGAFLLIAGLGLNSAVFGMLYRPTKHEGRRVRTESVSRQKLGEAAAAAAAAEESARLKQEDVTNEKKSTAHEPFLNEDSEHKWASSSLDSTQPAVNKQVLCEDATAEGRTKVNESMDLNGKTATDLGTGDYCLKNTTAVLHTDITNESTRFTDTPETNSNPLSYMEDSENYDCNKCSRKRRWTFEEKFSGIRAVMQNTAFCVHCASVFLASIEMGAVYMHLPEYCITLGTSPTKAAALFVGTGTFSVVSRLASGFLLTSFRVDAFSLNVTLLTACGAVTSFFPLYSSTYPGQMVFACLFGLSTGGIYIMFNVLTVRLIGYAHFTAAYGIVVFATGAGYVLGPPISGLVMDNGGTYEQMLILIGVIMFVAVISDVITKMMHARTGNPEGPCQDVH